MRFTILDDGFRRDPRPFFLQSAIAAFIVMVLMVLHQVLPSPALIAALGASSFVAFTMPNVPLSSPRRLIGGYACGVIVGVACHFVLQWQWLLAAGLPEETARIALAGLSVGLGVLTMVALDMEHAPAASIVLGLVLDEWRPWNILYVMAGIIVLAVLKELVRPILRDLI